MRLEERAAMERSMPLAALTTLPAWTGLRLTTQAFGAATGRGLGAGAGIRGAMAALAGNGAGLLGARRAWRKRLTDRHAWAAGERAMLSHIMAHRATGQDILPRS